MADPRDPRLITIRRGGSLTDEDHHLLALWAADCAEHVLTFFEDARPHDDRPRLAIAAARAWAAGEIKMIDARQAAIAANAAARDLTGAARHSAHAAGQAAGVAHMADHEMGAAFYGIRAVQVSSDDPEADRQAECSWQRAQLPAKIRQLVLDDQQRRNAKCWNVFTSS